MLRTVRTENGWVKGIEAADPRITAFKGNMKISKRVCVTYS